MLKILLSFIFTMPSALTAGERAPFLLPSLEKMEEIGVPAPTERDLPQWLIAVYMNGKSNIEPFALHDFNRLETAGSTEKVKIVAEIGRSRGFDNDTEADGDWTGVRRYLVKKDSDMEKINSELLSDLGDRDMGSWEEAADFLSWAKARYPARKTLFLIWDHGWGWLNPTLPGSSLLDEQKSISHDFAANSYIKTQEIRNIFAKAGPVDLYASMACFMQMAEVAYEIRDYAGVIVGSEEVIQLPSFNFEDFLSLMLANPESGAEKAGIYLVDTFKEMYSRPEYLDMLEKNKYGTQLSAIRGAQMENFAGLADKWAKAALAFRDDKAFSKAKKEVLRFEVGELDTDPDKLISFYADIHDFINIVLANADRNKPGYADFRKISEKLTSLIDEKLVIKNVYLSKDRTGKDYSRTHGISIYMPGKPGHLLDYEDDYSELLFAKRTSWEKFADYLKRID